MLNPREEALILAGKKMANICHNLSRNAVLSSTTRQSLKETQEEWDRALGYVDLRNLAFVKD